ncbi:transcription antitermination factor NusB [Thermocrinis minervae]|uniref:Transcription antitermination protein NusB n=1 Tax=Thermocrinis minervae TaxID=381751 RepID=A0A1M6T4K5_9AQUI|nr:transcription antitermination factor NusB [Thermocrinis minervae]SHK51881.1 NusB antitermination factor [Thermocrinis minervae]
MIYKQKAREDAFLVLYQWDIKGDPLEDLVEEVIKLRNITYSERRRYLRKLIRTYMQKAKDVDKAISESLISWDFDRLGYIERGILRAAFTELLYVRPKNIKKVVEDYEDLADKYAGDKARKFVSGILKALEGKLSTTQESDQ